MGVSISQGGGGVWGGKYKPRGRGREGLGGGGGGVQ